jgi:hypothetical protein
MLEQLKEGVVIVRSKMILLCSLSLLVSGCSTVGNAAGGLYEAVFPGANFSPEKYQTMGFDLATSPSAADRNRHKKLKFDAYYFGVARDLGKNEIISQHINIKLCSDPRGTDCSNKIAVHDLDASSVTSLSKGAAVIFYGMVGEVQSLDYGDISVSNKGGSLNGLFFLKSHKIMPR